MAAGFKFVAGLAIGNFMPTYFGKNYSSKEDSTIYSIGNSAVVSLCGFVSAFLGGLVCDKLAPKGYDRI